MTAVAFIFSFLLPVPLLAQAPPASVSDALPASLDEPLTTADDAAHYLDQRVGWKTFTAAQWRTCLGKPAPLNHWVKTTSVKTLTDEHGNDWTWAQGDEEHIAGYESLNNRVYALCLGGRWLSLSMDEPIRVSISADLKEVAVVTRRELPWNGGYESSYWRLRANEVGTLGKNGATPSLRMSAWLSTTIQEKDAAEPTSPVTLDLDPGKSLGGFAVAMALKSLDEEKLLGPKSPFRDPALRVVAGGWLQARLAGRGVISVTIRPHRSQLIFMGKQQDVLEIHDPARSIHDLEGIDIPSLRRKAASLTRAASP